MLAIRPLIRLVASTLIVLFLAGHNVVDARATCKLVKRASSSTSTTSTSKSYHTSTRIASSTSSHGGTSTTSPTVIPTASPTGTSPSGPHFVIYSDQYISGENGPPDVSMVKGFSVFALSFLLLSGAADQAVAWTQIDSTQRAAVKAQYAAQGISIIVSAFGSTDAPTSTNADPVGTANTMAAWVKQYNLDGIDVDYEDFDAFDAKTGAAETWIISFMKQLRTQLPSGQYTVTHAPVAPWFEKNAWSGGGYLAIDTAVGNLIDWYNIQFYNQGSTEYTDCNGLLTTSGGSWPGTSLFEIAANGIPLSKLVIGKPAQPSDASNGYIEPSTLASCAMQAKNQGWDAGVMTWEYPQANATWIQTVRAQAWPE